VLVSAGFQVVEDRWSSLKLSVGLARLERVGRRPASEGSSTCGDLSAGELAGAPGPAISLGEDDEARCGGQGPRAMTTGGWHGGVGVGAARSQEACGSEQSGSERAREEAIWSGTSRRCPRARGKGRSACGAAGKTVGIGKRRRPRSQCRWRGRCFEIRLVTVDLGWPNPSAMVFPVFENCSNLQIQIYCFPRLKNGQTFHETRFEHGEQLSPLAKHQIPTASHVIKFGTDSNLNLP
jgi:hypothetical protein